MTAVFDAGALIALERGDRTLAAYVKRERLAGRPAITHGGVLGQVWRGGARQVSLARLVLGLDVRPLDEDLGKRAGVLLGRTGGRDVVDAALVLLAAPGDVIVTSDVGDLAELASTAGLDVTLAPV